MADEILADLAQGWLERLQSNGYRLTAPRQAVVETIASSPYVLNPMEVYEQARQRYSRLGLVTVYRTMEKLELLGLLQRVHQPSGCQGFVPASTGHQHLLVCQNCKRVQVFQGDLEQMDTLIDEVGKNSGYRIDDHWLQLFGLCSACQTG
jgi:Fur family transcriptional regulator, ferric uptake regulator